MEYTNPLDYLITSEASVKLRSLREEVEPFFGEGTTGEVTLPEDTFDEGPSVEESEFSEEANETPGEEALEHSDEPRDVISELKRKISDLKEEITEKLKPLFPEDKTEELAEALDDATSALDLCDHHLSDIDNKLSGEAPSNETGEEGMKPELGNEELEPEFDFSPKKDEEGMEELEDSEI